MLHKLCRDGAGRETGKLLGAIGQILAGLNNRQFVLSAFGLNGEYELLAGLTPVNHALAVKLASIPEDIRGYGHIKDANLDKAKRKEAELLAQWRNPAALKAAAE